MSRKWIRAAAVLVAAGMAVSTAWAQEPGRGRGQGRGQGPGGRGFGGMGMMGMQGGGGAMSLVMLASNEEVAKHLKMTDDEKAFLKLLGEEMREESMKFFQSLRDLPQEERMSKVSEWAAKQGPETEKRLQEILGDKVKRLKQVRLQVEGARAFSDAEVQKQLSMTDDQKQKLRDMFTASFGEMREIFQSAGDDPDARRKAMDDFRKSQDEKALAILTDSQRTKLKEMQGEPIDFKVDMSPRGMMGFGGGRGRGPGGGDDAGPPGGENKRRKRSKKGGADGSGL